MYILAIIGTLMVGVGLSEIDRAKKKIILKDNCQKRKPNYFLKFVLVDWLAVQKAEQFLV